MGFYAERLFPWLLAHTDTGPLRRERSQLLDRATGRVLEVGYGTAANRPFYPDRVERLVAIEPSAGMIRKVRGEATPLAPVTQIVRASGEALPFADARFDTVVAVLVLCTVADARQVLAEIVRVLEPGTGRLLFLEHVRSQEEKTHRWQRRIEPIWKRVGCGCHLTRDTAQSLEDGGFEGVELDRFMLHGSPAFVGTMIRGSATRPA